MANMTWANSDTGTRARMNQPYWMVSGTVAGTGDAAAVVRVFISPGTIRFPNSLSPVSSTGLQSAVFGPTTASTAYSVFMRPDGTFVVSGNQTGFDAPTAPPRHDAEYLGYIVTGNPNNTVNLMGPWNDGGTRELRGEYVAITAARPRAVYHDLPFVGSFLPKAYGSIKPDSGGLSTTSGLAFLSLSDSGYIGGTRTVLTATVQWVPSGAMTERIVPTFTMWRGEDGVGTPLARWMEYDTTNQLASGIADPDNTGYYRTSTYTTINTGTSTSQGYGFGVFLQPIGAQQCSIRIAGLTFIARPGHQSSDTNEPT